MQRFSQRLLLEIHSMDWAFKCFSWNFSQSYVQSKRSKRRPIFVRPLLVLNLSSEVLLQAETPLHAIPHAALHWYNTCQIHHSNNRSLVVLNFLQTDSAAICGDIVFSASQSKMAASFNCKPAKMLPDGDSISFRCAHISVDSDVCSISQNDYTGRLQEIPFYKQTKHTL